MGYVAGEGAATQHDGSGIPRDFPESPQQSVLAQPAEPSSMTLPNETVKTLADGGGARVPISLGTPVEEARILLVTSGEGISRVADEASLGPVIIILKKAAAPHFNVP